MGCWQTRVYEDGVSGLIGFVFKITMAFYIFRNGYRFLLGDKDKVSTLWYGVILLIGLISLNILSKLGI